MAVTLQQARNLTQDKLCRQIIDEFRKSPLLEMMIFDDNVAMSGGSTLNYVYNRIKTEGQADFRKINNEYERQESDTELFTTTLKQFGGKFGIDRVIQKHVKGITDQLSFQLKQKIKATKALWNDTFINGDTATNENAFDGLDKAITGSSTHYTPIEELDLSTTAAMDKNYKAICDEIDQWLALLDGEPTCLLMNKSMKAKMNGIARRNGYYSQVEGAFGKKVDAYNSIPMVEMGDKPGTSNPIIETDDEGKTCIYAVRIDLDGVHGITPDGNSVIEVYLPDFSTPGAVKDGEVEMVSAMAVKATRSAGKLDNIKIK